MKNFKLNEKGFTLVELLAVIVILAVLIVITANTAIPMMNKSKKTAMVTYAERVLNNAAASYQADTITSGSDTTRYYSIQKLMGTDDYYGCAEVAYTSGSPLTYRVVMYSLSDKYKFLNSTGVQKATFNATVETLVSEVTTKPAANTLDDDTECTVDDFS